MPGTPLVRNNLLIFFEITSTTSYKFCKSSYWLVKPHLLERNKIKQVQLSASHDQYTASIKTNDTTGSSGGSFLDHLGSELSTALTASYTESIVTPVGELNYTYHLKERARYDGELSGSIIKLVKPDGDLNDDNIWKYRNISTVTYMGELVELDLACRQHLGWSEPTPHAMPSWRLRLAVKKKTTTKS